MKSASRLLNVELQVVLPNRKSVESTKLGDNKTMSLLQSPLRGRHTFQWAYQIFVLKYIVNAGMSSSE
jgi:hypothetical protein